MRARGDEAPLELVVEDGGCRFGVDVTAPLGVGLFPDMRLGWAAVAARAAGRRVLNLFSYTGAFSVHAAKAGAAEVVAVDTAAKAHARARRNFELSGLDRRAPRDDDRRRDQDAGAVRVARALVRYRRLRSADVLARPGGAVLGRARSGASSRAPARPCSRRAACSCSPATRPSSRPPISTARCGEGGADARAELRIVERVGLPPDFPVAPGFPEGNYLKVAIAIRVP